MHRIDSDPISPRMVSWSTPCHRDRFAPVEASESIRVSRYDRDLVFFRVVQLQVGCEWPAHPKTHGGQSHHLKQTNGEHARIHKRVPPPLESLGGIQHQLPELGSRLTLVNIFCAKWKIWNGTDNAPRIRPPFHIRCLQSLLQISGDLGELRHIVIEHLRVLARDGLEHSRSAENRHIGASCADYSFIR